LVWSPPLSRRNSFLIVLFAFLFSCTISYPSRAQLRSPTSDSVDFNKIGTRFEIKISVKADADVPKVREIYDQATALMTVKLRISAHARESQYFGEVRQDFSRFSVIEGSPDLSIWKETRCHQRRGLPKVTVVALDGLISTKLEQIHIEARPRHLGLHLPGDEIGQGLQLSLSDRAGAIMGYRSASKSSHLLVDVKVYAFDCDLLPETLVR
jgi:hypothetical protein